MAQSPDASARHSTPFSPQDLPKGDEASESTKTELQETLKRYMEIGGCAAQWGSTISKMGFLELRRSISAYKAVVGMRVVQVPILLTLYVSICVSIYISIHQLTGSPYWGLLAFLGFQLILLIIVQMRIQHFAKMIGFDSTKRHLKAAWNDLTEED